MKAQKFLVAISASLLASQAIAADFFITKQTTPSNLTVISTGGFSSSSHTAISNDFPKGTLLRTKTLTKVQWNTTYYPGANGEKVSLCYYRPAGRNLITFHYRIK